MTEETEENKRRKRPWWKPSIGATIFIGLVALWWGVPHFLMWRADMQVKELCAKDGGVKVYETVTLPPEMFNQWGQVKFYKPTQKEDALGKEYIFKVNSHYYKKGYLSLRRYHVQILRRKSKKLLGESISYDRGGGDPIGPWGASSFSCPNLAGEVPLLKKVFEQLDGGTE